MVGLHWAAAYNESRIVSLILKHPKISVNIPNKRGGTPLHSAVAHSAHSSLEVLLNDPRVDIDAKNQWGETPLFMAAHNGDKQVAKMLLERGAKRDIKDIWGNSPWQSAGSSIFFKHDEIADHGEKELAHMIENFDLEKEKKMDKSGISISKDNAANVPVKKVKVLSKIMEAPLDEDQFISWLEDIEMDINSADFYRYFVISSIYLKLHQVDTTSQIGQVCDRSILKN
jgi:hypothetical protein